MNSAVTSAATRIDIDVKGMTCASCVGRVERAITKLPDVRSASVNLATGRATVMVDNRETAVPAITAAIEAAGYEAVPHEQRAASGAAHDHRHEDEDSGLLRDLSIAAALTLPLFMLEMGSHLVPGMHHWLLGLVPQATLNIAYFALATAVLFGPGFRFLAKGIPALLRGAPEMNALVAIGTLAAWSYSSIATFLPTLLPAGQGGVYFEAAAVIVTLILLGRLLEARARGRAGEAIRAIAQLQAPRARRVEAGVVLDIPAEAIAVGDILEVRPGDRVPVDGTIISGASHIDESMLTGEPVPVSRSPGDTAIGGSIATNGSFRFRAERIGADTTLAQIIRLVEDAQADKLPIQLLVDKITYWFVPAVLGLSILTLGVWLVLTGDVSLAMTHAVAVLIIACPCAMGLATPTSILVGSGRAAALGVLFRRGDALQGLGGVRHVAFDKTGTMTVGRPELTGIAMAEGFDEADALRLAASAEQNSEHPLGDALVRAAKVRGLSLAPADSFAATAGHGISARIDGHEILVGAARHLAAEGITTTALADAAAKFSGIGASPVYLAIDGRLAALFAISDTLKPSAAAAVRQLRGRGIGVTMITGDNARTAAAIAETLGIADVRAEVLPGDKADIVNALRSANGRVAFVGDGINDAPALAAADIGIAMGTGTEIAMESADVVLVGGDPMGVPKAIALSRATTRNIAENLIWAFGYNVLLIPVAAGLLYPAFGLSLSPMLAAGAMALSSVFVVGNALRLRGVNIGGEAGR
ncbi:Cu+-exporting ATPase [Devosia enhydra]|uniref:P-type Cu(+) transporter n=1 Tax=Devosia enhydra TaxID=665118 RepID=A0A1K2HU38_9HYPH|nr:heavy metal translocating P-type ATPase [Devosia enhydra]SFZ81919.1 Cu+-exporting ATPase [Devosia enhydra]